MPYYDSDLTHYITKCFFNIDWYYKILKLQDIIYGLAKIHDVNIIHRDLHSGNILLGKLYYESHSDEKARICDLGTSKSATESTDYEDEIYGIIPYVAPEVLQGKTYTKASDIYSFGMIMWELMVGRRPFWDRNHNTELIIEICDGLRPSIITNAPEGYIDLMKECWHSDPEKRPTAAEVSKKIQEIWRIDTIFGGYSKTKIIISSDIGPVTTNNPDAIYKSRYLSGMIKSAASTRSLRSQSITVKLDQLDFDQRNSNVKRKFEDNQFENNFINGTSNKKIKPIEDKNNVYATKELEFDIDINSSQSKDDGKLNI
ncbi:kinase-like domain-containing protein [Rhizophagus irregularis DAOM 181602=DAOM 197198]|uniref:Kinase-like domain-containing protein n=1 Tax=Rhizophagus irregularis (strain DAOM 181602 / DAOM 197198 / MUCL 43194) TaxID=747089 RepID=A0A2P4Q0F8_RHIID|nr:kinase-like domain-containing protein [Rhizophagus irregularis DAOM 181602=DAOM 197198]POG71114.1 kinase-like domain-containing protein [Rhizophagus irregularis DAOM 181602=DAOM 197198]|eukprot:XP_025177980.1 kinase-like domain-containing protein [Rhizophagus irregularis DAOM 181602=DAOM 197198]